MLKYDKLKNMNNDEIEYNFICPHCQANGLKKGVFELSPLGVSYKPNLIDNSDIENEYIKKSLDKLPTFREALKYALRNTNDKIKIHIKCNNCNKFIIPTGKLTINMLNKWISKNLEYYMVL